MNALELGPGERAIVAQAAIEYFKLAQSVFQALYPVKPESITYLITSINAEAGRHPIPAASVTSLTRTIASALGVKS